MFSTLNNDTLTETFLLWSYHLLDYDFKYSNEFVLDILIVFGSYVLTQFKFPVVALDIDMIIYVFVKGWEVCNLLVQLVDVCLEQHTFFLYFMYTFKAI